MEAIQEPSGEGKKKRSPNRKNPVPLRVSYFLLFPDVPAGSEWLDQAQISCLLGNQYWAMEGA